MNPKEKAIELVLKYLRLQDVGYDWFNKPLAKKCAIIAVDEIMNTFSDIDERRDYWNEVKDELNYI